MKRFNRSGTGPVPGGESVVPFPIPAQPTLSKPDFERLSSSGRADPEVYTEYRLEIAARA
jgi:hypothetical protein